MSKRDDKHDMAKDYLAQLKWEADHPYDPKRGYPSWSDEPKRKYKRVFGGTANSKANALFLALIWWVAVISTFGYLFYQIFVGHNWKDIFASIVVLSMLAMFYFIAREPK